MSRRVREVLGELDSRCRSCSGCLIAVETRSAPQFLDHVRDFFRSDPDRRVTRYDRCLDCGSTVRVRTLNPRRVSGGDTLGPGYVVL